MARPSDMMGLGMSAHLAKIVGVHVSSVTAGGSSAGSATQIGGNNRTVIVNASNSGSGIKLPAVNADTGVLIGDELIIANLLSAAVQCYAANNALGSVVKIFMDGGSIVGTTGFSVSSGKPVIMVPITVSTWIGIRSV